MASGVTCCTGMPVGYARTKGRPTPPRELPTGAEVAAEQWTRRRPSHFEQLEQYLIQRSSGTSFRAPEPLLRDCAHLHPEQEGELHQEGELYLHQDEAWRLPRVRCRERTMMLKPMLTSCQANYHQGHHAEL